MKSARTFLAVDLLPGQRRKACRIIEDLQQRSDQFKWSREENLHITLNFLGPVPEVELNQVCDAAAQAVQGIPAFDIQVEGLGAFPILERPRVVWAGVTEGRSQLQELQQHLEAGLEPLGFPPDRRQYRPHLTLGRIKRAGKANSAVIDYVRQHETIELGASCVDSVIVFSSFLDRSGPVYTPLTTIELA